VGKWPLPRPRIYSKREMNSTDAGHPFQPITDESDYDENKELECDIEHPLKGTRLG
jgi:hypothetical protein